MAFGRKLSQSTSQANSLRTTGGDNFRSQAARNADVKNALDSSVPVDGTDGATLLTTFFGGGSGSYFLPKGAYTLSANVDVPAVNRSVSIDPGATFPSTGWVNFYPSLLYQGAVVKGNQLLVKTVGDTEGNFNYFMNANQITNNGEPNAVAVFGQGISNSTTGSAWGGNFVGYSTLSGAVAIGVEINFGALASGGHSYGLVVAAAGSYNTNAALQVQANNSNAKFIYALRINGDSVTSAGYAIQAAALTCAYGVDLEGSVFSTAEYRSAAFKIDPTPTSFNSRLRLTGGSGSTGPILRIEANGDTPATNADFNHATLGTGTHRFFTNGLGVEAFRVNHVASAVNQLRVSPSVTTAPVILLAAGSDANIDIELAPKGSGVVRLGTHSAIAAETVTGYITIKDAGGTTRKLAVVS